MMRKANNNHRKIEMSGHHRKCKLDTESCKCYCEACTRHRGGNWQMFKRKRA